MDREFAAGGLVCRAGNLLLVRVTNLEGAAVWSFPKGHVEKGETSEEAALREVEEETGWNCRITGDLTTVGYKFMRQGRLVDKKVRWFWMAPVKKTGKPDAVEVSAARWANAPAAEKLLSYPSDLKLLELFKSRN